MRPPAVVVPCRHTRCFINHSDPVHPCCGRGRRSRRRGGREAVCWFSRCCRRRSISGQREALHPSHYGRGGARGADNLESPPLAPSRDGGVASRSIGFAHGRGVRGAVARGTPMPPLRHRLRRHALDPFRPIEKLKPEHRRRAVVEVVVDHRRFGIEPEHHRRAVQRSSRVATAYSARACQMTEDNDRVPGRANLAPYLDRTCSIQWQSGILGWTVFRLPSTPGRHVVCTVAARPPPLHALARRSAVVPVSQSGTTSSVLSRFGATARDESLRGWRGQWPPPTSSLLLAGRDTTSSTSTMTQFFWRVSPLT